jgi:pSer/pThr/pTyr-binding forkhead associated (FHA) protein
VPWATVFAVFCNNCGQRNPEGVNFCSACGHALATGGDATVTLHPGDHGDSAAEGSPSVSLGEVPHGSGVLVVTRGPNVGARYIQGEGTTQAGRHPDSDIFLDDITVSRRHAEFTQEAGGTFAIADVGSLNGTNVNRERIDKVSLVPQDEVQIGKFKLVYVAAGHE